MLLRGLPAALSTNWRRRGFLVDYRSLGRALRSVSLIFGGFVHAVLAFPVPATFYRGTPGIHDAGALVAGVLVLGVAIVVPVVTSVRRHAIVAELPAALALLIAVALAVADRVPLGDGRTDEVLYPALLCCLAAVVRVVSPLAVRVVGVAPRAKVGATALAGALVVATALFAVAQVTLSTRSICGTRNEERTIGPESRCGKSVNDARNDRRLRGGS